jgi:ankyrin repeat protein
VGCIESVKLLVTNALAGKRGGTAPQKAAAAGNLQLLEFLLKAGADVNVTSQDVGARHFKKL